MAKWQICLNGIFDAEMRYARHTPTLCGEAAATNITFQVESGFMTRSAGEALAEPFDNLRSFCLEHEWCTVNYADTAECCQCDLAIVPNGMI